jgi:CHASE1-domain containing sensor protein
MDVSSLAAAVVVLAFVVAVAWLVYWVVGAGVAVGRATRESRAALEREIVGLSTAELRRRIVEDPYLADTLRASAEVRAFIDRVARGDEAALVREHSHASLYGVLARAEHEAGGTGRPEAVDAVNWLWPYLEALSRRGGVTPGAEAAS